MKYIMKPIGIIILIILGFVLFYLGYEYDQFSKVKKAQIQKLNEGSHIMVTDVGTIEYAIKGEGYPVLMIHGAGGGYDQGLLLADYLLPKHCKIIAVSRFGYLKTPLPKEATPNHQAALYKALLDGLGIKQINVVGVSDGGPSALKFGILYPRYTKSLTMIAAKSQTPPEQTPLQAAVFGTIFDHDFLFWMITEHLSSQLSSVLGVSKEVQETMTDHEKSIASRFFASMSPISLRKAGIFNANVQFKILLPEDYPIWEIKAPTLVVHAKDDTLQPFYYAEYTHEQIEHSQLLSFDKGGHMLFGQSDVVIEATEALFKSVE